MRAFVVLSVFCGFSAASIFPIRAPTCNCKGKKIQDGGKSSSGYICHDSRLGPNTLPKTAPESNIFLDYDRFGGLTPEKFLEAWTNKTGGYKYPPNNGFKADQNNKSTAAYYTLPRGVYMDHFGSEQGLCYKTLTYWGHELTSHRPLSHSCFDALLTEIAAPIHPESQTQRPSFPNRLLCLFYEWRTHSSRSPCCSVVRAAWKWHVILL